MFITIYITNRCNGNCRFCGAIPNFPKNKGKINNVAIVESLASVLKNKKITGCCISGGEPTLSPILYDVVEILNNNNIPVFLNTNGTRIIKKGTYKYIVVSRHHYDEYIHNRVTKTTALSANSMLSGDVKVENFVCSCLLLRGLIDSTIGVDKFINAFNDSFDYIMFTPCSDTDGIDMSSDTQELKDYIKGKGCVLYDGSKSDNIEFINIFWDGSIIYN